MLTKSLCEWERRGSRGALLSLLGWLKLMRRLGSDSGRSGVCCSLLAWEGTIRWQGFRDSGTKELSSDSQQTALGFRNR